MIPTPDLSHLTKDDYERVYEPAEDTFVLLDALEQDAQELVGMRPLVCLEIGSGSGCVSCFLGRILGPSAAVYLCTDINPHASRCTLSTGTKNNIPVNPITTSFANPFLPRLRNAVDILLFNPPYVPTPPRELAFAQSQGPQCGIHGSWAGGSDGMQVTDKLLRHVPELLSDRGRFYLVAIKQNDLPAIREKMMEAYSLHSKIVLQRRAGREHLFVVRFCRQPT